MSAGGVPYAWRARADAPPAEWTFVEQPWTGDGTIASLRDIAADAAGRSSELAREHTPVLWTTQEEPADGILTWTAASHAVVFWPSDRAAGYVMWGPLSMRLRYVPDMLVVRSTVHN